MESTSNAKSTTPTKMQFLGDDRQDRRRSQVFRPSQSSLWRQKSMAREYEAMLECAMDQKMEFEASEGNVGTDHTDDKFHVNVNVESYNTLLSEFDLNETPDISDLQLSLNVAFVGKVQALHDKISTEISSIAPKLQMTHDDQLTELYQKACDFLADVQHELTVFEEDIAQNEKRANNMERETRNLANQYQKVMMKLKESNAKQNDLRKRNHELSNINMHLSSNNLLKTTQEDTKEDVIKQSFNLNANSLLFWFMIWMIGTVFRYFILFPIRLLILTNVFLFTLVQFWIWEKAFSNDPQALELWKLWSLQLLVGILLRYGVIDDEYTDIMPPRKQNEIYTVSLCYPSTQKRIYSCAMRDLEISFALFG